MPPDCLAKGGIDDDIDDKGAILKIVVPDTEKGLYKWVDSLYNI